MGGRPGQRRERGSVRLAPARRRIRWEIAVRRPERVDRIRGLFAQRQTRRWWRHDKTVRVWDVSNLSLVGTMSGATDEPRSTFVRDGKGIAATARRLLNAFEASSRQSSDSVVSIASKRCQNTGDGLGLRDSHW